MPFISHNAIEPQGVNMYCCDAEELVMTGREAGSLTCLLRFRKQYV